MSRSRDAYRLARTLDASSGVTVAVTWSGSSRRDAYSGWLVQHVDGPTVPTMRQLVAEALTKFPSFCDAQINCHRATTDLSEALALMAWLEEHPDDALSLRSWSSQDAYDVTEYPERITGSARRRAVALCSLGVMDLDTWEQVRHYGSLGYPALCCWLDGISDDLNANVVQLRP